MPSTASTAVPVPPPWAKPMVWFGWLAALSALAYFVYKYVPRYFVLTPESYGKYFWPKAGWLFPHVLGGLVAALLGPLQFVPKIRRDHLQFHRIAGRLYVVMVFVGGFASFGMSTRVDAEHRAYGLGLAALAVAWFVTTGMAFVAIRRKNLAQHKQWMIRSYVVTFAFVTFRLVDEMIRGAKLMPDSQLDAVLAWGCWAVPLLLTEVILQAREVFKSRA